MAWKNPFSSSLVFVIGNVLCYTVFISLIVGATFLLPGKLPTPSNYAARRKSSDAKLSFAIIVLLR